MEEQKRKISSGNIVQLDTDINRSQVKPAATKGVGRIIKLATDESRQTRFETLFETGLAISEADAWSQGEVGYVCRTLVQATLPYKEPKDNPAAWGRTNGRVSLVIQPGFYFESRSEVVKGRTVTKQVPVSLGYPYGSIPRLLLAWVGKEVKQHQNREIQLGHSLVDFMRELGMTTSTGGKNGNITRLREQMRRTFASKIAIMDNPETTSTHQQWWQNETFSLVDKTQIWWDSKASPNQNQQDLFESKIALSERFYNELMQSPVPVDMRALRVLKGSPSAIDLYCYLTYRIFSIKREVTVPWDTLRMQFGSQILSPRKFRWQFAQALRQVLLVYPDARADLNAVGLVMKPSPTSVKRRLG